MDLNLMPTTYMMMSSSQEWMWQILFSTSNKIRPHIYIIQNYSEFKLDLNLTVPPDGRTMIHTYTISNLAVVSALLVDDLHS
jgi:hypothetical protein